MRRLLKALLAAATYYTGLAWLLRVLAARRGQALIVTYHAVDRDLKGAARAELEAGLIVTQATLRRQLRHLVRRYPIVPLSKLADALASGGRGLGGTCAITFDDAITGLVENAVPVLRELDVPATVFVPTDYVDAVEELPAWRVRRALWAAGASPRAAESCKRRGRDAVRALAETLAGTVPTSQREALGRLLPRTVLGSEGIKQLALAGVTIGSHAGRHDPLPSLPRPLQRQDLVRSKARLEQIVDEPVTCLSYPHGSATSATAKLAADAGYLCGCTTQPGSVRRSDDPLLLHRVALDEYSSAGVFGFFSPSHFEATLRWRAMRRPADGLTREALEPGVGGRPGLPLPVSLIVALAGLVARACAVRKGTGAPDS